MGEIADYYVDQAMKEWGGQGYRNSKPYNNFVNPYLSKEDYQKLVNYLTKSMSNATRLTEPMAKRYIFDNLVKRGKIPYPRESRLSPSDIVAIYNIVKNAGLKLEGYNFGELKRKAKLEAEKERAGMYTDMRVESEKIKRGMRPTSVPKAEVESLFRVEAIDVEEGEFSIVLERGMYREVVAVSYAYPHYRKLGFYAGRKASIFSKDEDTDKMVVDMYHVLNALAILLNNLASADKLDEDAYNNSVDGFEPFIYEALDFSEIESLIGKTSGLKDGKKKRIKARGTKGSSLQNK